MISRLIMFGKFPEIKVPKGSPDKLPLAKWIQLAWSQNKRWYQTRIIAWWSIGYFGAFFVDHLFIKSDDEIKLFRRSDDEIK